MTVAVKQLRHVFSVVSGATPKTSNAANWDGDIPWATPEDVTSTNGYWLRSTRRTITVEGYESCGTRMAPPESIVLTKRAPIGQVALLADEACANQGCFLLVPRREADTRFYYYWLVSQTAHLEALGRGSTFMELSTDELRSLHVPHPSLRLQRAIADDLDDETARLDTLIAAIRHVIELLNARRQVIIAQAVTRGLDPVVSLHDSRIAWLGPIPTQWQTEKARWLFRERDERTNTGDEELLTVSHLTGVTPRSEKVVNMFEAATNEGYKICRSGDLVVNTMWAWMGCDGCGAPRRYC